MDTTMNQSPRIVVARLALACVAASLVVAGGPVGCRGDRSTKRPRQFLPDMDDSPKWKPQSASEFFADGRTMRPAVEGAVPFGRFAFVSDEPWAGPFMQERIDGVREDDAIFRGTDASGAYLDRVPVEVTPELLALGERKFGIYCAVCHGLEGDGQGMVGKRWAAPVANFHDPRFQDTSDKEGKWKDGYLFHIGRNGLWNEADGKRTSQRMPGYAHALSERETWAVVAHIRVLQRHRKGAMDDVPANLRERIERERQTLMAQATFLAPAAPASSAPTSTPAPGGKP
jgi:mono/diheme cytochrome c family protein